MKTRITVSVDEDVAAEATRAVKEGRAASVSAWVSEAITEKADRESKLRALETAIAAFEREHGPLADVDGEALERSGREEAAVRRSRVRKKLGL